MQKDILQEINKYCMIFDTEYGRDKARGYISNSILEEAQLAMDENIDPEHSVLLRKKGEALNCLCDYIDKLNEICGK